MGFHKGDIPWNKGRVGVYTKERIIELKEAIKGNKYRLGKFHTKETKEKMSEAQKREKNGNWKGGFQKHENGYILFKVPEGHKFSCMKGKGGYTFLHRLVMAEYLQRPLRTKEVVHHINGDVTDNRIENLRLLENQGEHNRLHKKKKEIEGNIE